LVTILIGCGVGLGVTINQLKRKNCCFCSSWCIVWRWERGATNKRINGDEYQKFRNDILSDGGVFGYKFRMALVFSMRLRDCTHHFFQLSSMQQVWRNIYNWMRCSYNRYDEGW
jgi:hypothetical protein